jgi:hypothetical protein
MMRASTWIHLWAGAAIAAAAGGACAQASGPLALAGQDVGVGAPTARIYRSVGRDGAVSFADHVAPGAQSVEVRSFPSSSEPSARERARQQQEYWRAQAKAFSERQRQRDQALEEERRARAEAEWREAEMREWMLLPRVVRAPHDTDPGDPVWGLGPVYGTPRRPAWGGPRRYSSTPGAAAGAPAAFIGSGFATSR